METLLDLPEHTARRYGRRRALAIKPGFRTRRWRHTDLADLVPRVATILRGAGVGQGDRVMIWALNRPEWGVSFLGILHAGGVVVPIDFRTTDDVAARFAEQTAPKLVLASGPTLAQASRIGLPTLTIEALVDLARSAEPGDRARVEPDDLAEIVFTSGTTGDPKGVMLTHRNLVTNIKGLHAAFPLGPGTRLLSILPLSHMFEQTAGFLTPLYGGTTLVYPTSRQPSVLVRTMRENRITMILMVPQVLKLLNNAIERKVDATGKRAAFERLHSIARRLPRPLRRILFRPVLRQFGGRLRYVAVGGAAMNPNLARRWEEMGVQVLQGYGATEASPVICFTRREHNRIGTVGQAIPGVEIRIADDGEVLVSGPGIFAGYWQKPDATTAVLTDGWYHTGDLGSVDDDGFLTLRGRKKDMLVLADGTKVYPEDVENAMSRDTRVREVAAIGLERPGRDLEVHAVLILADGADPDDVVRQANATLGSHQQVRGFSVWPDEDFPRTPALKVKKRDLVDWILAAELPRPESGGDAGGPDSAVPVSDAGAFAARIDSVVVDAIRPDARLSSDLGLDSLGRVELLGLIEEELGVYIDDAALEPETTLADLDAMIEAARGERRETGIFGWPLHPAVGAVRLLIQDLIIRPLVTLFYRRRIRGLGNLLGLEGPVMFVANHHLHTDNAILLCSIPLEWRRKLSVAAAADDIFGNPIRGFGAALLGNAFPLAREGAVRRSLELLGARLDRDFSVLIYPEGKLTVGGPMQPFKSGTGLVAVQGAVPVVPMKLKINRMSWIDERGTGTSLRGDVEVVFGAPIRFNGDMDMNVATQQIEQAVAAL